MDDRSRSAGNGFDALIFSAMTDRLAELLRPRLKSGRFKHTQGVVRTAARLAKRHHLSVQRVETAAWLHDCAKAMEREDMKRYLGRAKADAQERRMPPLWHAPVGAYLAEHEYGVKDPEILRAIRVHSTGAPKMSKIQKALFVADYTEPGRPDWPELKELRPLSLKDLDRAFFEVLRHKIMDLLQNNRPLHKRSVDAYHFSLKSLS
jgi:predicted HD superfamily hydrolase involved in NAD metabolism